MKTPAAREQRARRLALLRNPPKVTKWENQLEATAILAELALIHDNPRLAGDKKHELFIRGAKQLAELK